MPRELVYPPDQTEEQVEQHNAEDFQNSQTSAETAALRELGYPVQVVVKEVAAGRPGGRRAARPATSSPRSTARRSTSADAADRADPGQAGRHRADDRLHPRRHSRHRDGHHAGRRGRHAADRRRARAAAAAPVHAGDRPRRHRRAERRADVRPRHHRQAQAGGPDRRQDHRRHRHHRRRGQRRPDRRHRRRSWSGAKDAGAKVFLVPADNCAEAVAQRRSPACRWSRSARWTRRWPRWRRSAAGGTPTPLLTA